MQQGCPQPHEEVPSALETLLLESASYIASKHCPTNAMEPNPPREANSRAAIQEIRSMLCNPKVYHHVHRSPRLLSVS
jgi:hypothetical protein